MPTAKQAAQSFIQARQRAEEAAASLDAARAALTSLAGHPKEEGAGVTVTRYWKQGGIDYKRIPQLQGVDLESYRKQGGEEVRVTVSG